MYMDISCFSVNLMTCMSVLTNAAKQRPQYMSRVIQAFEALHGKWITFKFIIEKNAMLLKLKVTKILYRFSFQ